MVYINGVKVIPLIGRITQATADIAIVGSDAAYTMTQGHPNSIAAIGGSVFARKRLEAIYVAEQHGDDYITVDCSSIPGLKFKAVIFLKTQEKPPTALRALFRRVIKAGIDSRHTSFIMPLHGWGIMADTVTAINCFCQAIHTFTNFHNLKFVNVIEADKNKMSTFMKAMELIPDTLMDVVPGDGIPGASILDRGLPNTAIADPPEIEIIGEYAYPENLQEPIEDPFLVVDREVFESLAVNDPCCICLNDLNAASTYVVNFLENDAIVKSKNCQHYLHQSCLTRWLHQGSGCPVCRQKYIYPTQPLNTKMHVNGIGETCDGHPNDVGWIKIKYVVPGGIQTLNHPKPGVPHGRKTIFAFIRNDEAGIQILNLLKKAFDLRYIFTVGDDYDGVNVIKFAVLHRTGENGNPPSYDDPSYYPRFLAELAKLGIRP